jgi:hypothetical protein
MKRTGTALIGLAMLVVTAGGARGDDADASGGGSGYPSDTAGRRSGYSYVRETAGEVSLVSRYNGRVDARRNLPVTVGDELVVSDGGRAEIGLADGNVLFAGGGTRVRFESLRDQQGEEDSFSVLNLVEGSVVLYAGGDNADRVPRVDTEDVTVYVSRGGRARVNYDSRRGTSVIGRSGSTEVRARAGSYRVRAGEYLQVRGDEEPDVERGSFSRDRFDIWAADRLESTDVTRSASARYVNRQYSNDVVALDGYGDWQHNDEYDADVWSPRVEAGWSPYSNGSWYYTPAGMTWWSYDPWGWYPFHYGSWAFSTSWNRWCWRPSYVYSPAWVYWAYTPSYVGWCPIGWYSYWSPWYDTYYRRQNWYDRSNVFFSINGVFNCRNVDFRGWNFTGHGGFGSQVGRIDVIPGARIAERLGAATVAISSRPMVVNARAGEARQAVANFVREAPRVIGRTASAEDSSRLAPILARQRTLPASTLQAIEQRAVVVDRGRLAGPGAADVAPRGARVERGASFADIAREPASRVERMREPIGGSPVSRETRDVIERGRPAQGLASPDRSEPGARSESDWRSRTAPRSIESRGRDNAAPEAARPNRSDTRSIDRETRPEPRSVERAPREETWRSRSEIPPARRVIEGSVPNRRSPESESAPRERSWRTQDRESGAPAREARPAPRERDSRPETAPPRDYRAEPGPPAREFRPAPRERDSRPASAPQREYRAEPAPRERVARPESGPPPRVERAPAPAAPPPPRAESRQAPAPPPDRGRKDN